MTSHFPQAARGSLKRRKRLSLKEKAEAARSLHNGASASSVMKHFGIGRSTVTKIRSKLPVLLATAHAHCASLDAKSFRNTHLPKFEAEVLTFIDIARSFQMPVTRAVIQQRSLIYRERLMEKNGGTEISQCLKEFTASNG